MIERCTLPNIHSNRNISWSSLSCKCLLNSAIQHLAKHKLDAAAVRLPRPEKKTGKWGRAIASQRCSWCLVPGRLGRNGPFLCESGVVN